MGFTVNATITPKAAAKMLISGEIDLTGNWSSSTVLDVFDELLELSIEEILQIVDYHHYGNIADIKYIPQFGKIDTVARVPDYFVEKGCSCADYPQMGFFLKCDINATLVANTKFGENHGKAAALLGVANCVNKRIVPSVLSRDFSSLPNEKKIKVLMKLLFRIPAVQIILKEAFQTKVNGYAPMIQLKESTMHRRGQCLRAIFRLMREYQNANLTARIDNIVWEDN